jgi:outer membrane immunogenic protein
MFRNMALGLAGALAFAGSANAGGGLKDMPFAPEPTWSGFYAGVYGGYGWSDSKVTSSYQSFSPANPFAAGNVPVFESAMSGTLHPGGFDVGGEAGLNWQAGSLVLGIEGSVGAFHLSDTWAHSAVLSTALPPVINAANPVITSHTTVDTDWLATVRGRLGIAFNRALIYGTGGAAFAAANFHQHNAYVTTVPVGEENASYSDTLTGWTAGGGIEYKLGGNWSGKIEYLHLDFGSVGGSTTFTYNAKTSTSVSHSADLKADIVQAGLNYHFNRAYEPLK